MVYDIAKNHIPLSRGKMLQPLRQLCGYVHHSRLQLAVIGEKAKCRCTKKKGIDTKQDLTCLWPRQKCVKCPGDFLLGLLDMSPAIICLSFAYCFRKNGGKCHEVPIYSSTNQRRIDICRMWWSLDGSFSQSDSKSSKASSNLIFWNSFVFKYIYIYMDLCIYIYIQCSSCL